MENSQPNTEREGTVGIVKAREYLKPIGRIPPLFTTAVRSLMLDSQGEGQRISAASQFLSMRLLRSPTMKAMVYYSALTFHHEKISNVPYLSSVDLMRLYAPGDLAALFGLIFCYRKAKSLGAYGSAVEWAPLLDSMITRLEVGTHLGYAMPKIGAGIGMLAGALPLISQSIVFSRDKIGFELYRDRLSKFNCTWDLDFEERSWGFNCLDLSANLLQLLGFGLPLVHGIMTGLSDNATSNESEPGFAPAFYMARKWLECLLQTGAAPTEKLPGQFYPLQKDLYKLLYEINEIKEKGSKHRFIDKRRDNINMQDTPQLFQEYLSELQQAEKVVEFMNENLPKELLDTLSEDDLREISGSRQGSEPPSTVED